MTSTNTMNEEPDTDLTVAPFQTKTTRPDVQKPKNANLAQLQ